MKLKALIPLSMILALSLTACSAGQINSILTNPSASPSASPVSGSQTSKGVFSNALSKRLLPLNTAAQSGNTGGGGQSQDANQAVGAPAPQAPRGAVAESSSGSKMAAPMADMAAGVSARMMAPWFGGGEFNQYVIQFAEENIFPANQANTLLKAYEQTVKPILAEWDSSARLVESRANLGLDGNNAFIEYISLPGADGNAEQLQPDYVFRFSSSNRKETLNVYLLKKETRVHRLVWGEPTIQLSKVKIDSSRAQELALKALTSRSSNPGYPVYPDLPEQQQPNLQIAYEVPGNATWQIQLNQQGQEQNRYFVSVSFDLKTTTKPVPMPAAAVKEPAIDPAGGRCVQIMPTYPEQSRVWGSVELDAASGEIKSVNRPVLYLPMYEAAVRCEGPLPVDLPKPPTEPSTTSSTQTQVSKG